MATEQTIDQCIHMVAVNWRRTNDPSFYEQSFPAYWASFKDIDDNVILSAINNFICDCTDTYQPPFGVIRKYVMDAVGTKEAKERKAAFSDCDDCDQGFREISFICRNAAGKYAMKLLKCACQCPAGTQRVQNIKGIKMLRFGELLEIIQNDERTIQCWYTGREQRELPLMALPAFNPLIQKQIEEAAERRKSITGLGSALAERRRQLKEMKR